jgi:hypothetical protein
MKSPSTAVATPHAAPRSGGAFQLTFLGDALVWLARTLDAVLLIIPLGRKQLHDFVDAARSAETRGPGREKHTLADLKLRLAQNILRDGEKPVVRQDGAGEAFRDEKLFVILPRMRADRRKDGKYCRVVNANLTHNIMIPYCKPFCQHRFDK